MTLRPGRLACQACNRSISTRLIKGGILILVGHKLIGLNNSCPGSWRPADRPDIRAMGQARYRGLLDGGTS